MRRRCAARAHAVARCGPLQRDHRQLSSAREFACRRHGGAQRPMADFSPLFHGVCGKTVYTPCVEVCGRPLDAWMEGRTARCPRQRLSPRCRCLRGAVSPSRACFCSPFLRKVITYTVFFPLASCTHGKCLCNAPHSSVLLLSASTPALCSAFAGACGHPCIHCPRPLGAGIVLHTLVQVALASALCTPAHGHARVCPCDVSHPGCVSLAVPLPRLPHGPQLCLHSLHGVTTVAAVTSAALCCLCA